MHKQKLVWVVVFWVTCLIEILTLYLWFHHGSKFWDPTNFLSESLCFGTC